MQDGLTVLAVLLSLDQDKQGTFFGWPGSTDKNKEAEMWPGTWQPYAGQGLLIFFASPWTAYESRKYDKYQEAVSKRLDVLTLPLDFSRISKLSLGFDWTAG